MLPNRLKKRFPFNIISFALVVWNTQEPKLCSLFMLYACFNFVLIRFYFNNLSLSFILITFTSILIRFEPASFSQPLDPNTSCKNGEDVHLVCEVKGQVASVRWEREGKEVWFFNQFNIPLSNLFFVYLSYSLIFCFVFVFLWYHYLYHFHLFHTPVN